VQLLEQAKSTALWARIALFGQALALCNNLVCQNAVLEEIRLRFPPQFDFGYAEVNAPQKIYWLLGISLNAILLVATVVVAVLVVCVWRIARFTKHFLLLLAAIFVMVGANLVWWAFQSARFQAQRMAAGSLLLFSPIISMCIIATMSIRWVFAFVFLVRGSEVIVRTEKIVSWIVAVICFVLACFLF
jgi:hypothetical protein